MSYEIETYPAYDLIGIEARLASGADFETIQALRDKFIKNESLNNITHKINDDFIALYTDYESDYSAGMNLVLGAKVSAVDDIPKGMVHKHVAEPKIRTFYCKR
jgi:predicted transcriptional regulator YdeE